jgi:integrase
MPRPQLKAMILLGVNVDWATLIAARSRCRRLDLEAGILDFPRPKTGIERRVPLWPETIKALREVIAKRGKPRNAEHAGLVFLTRLGQRGCATLWLKRRMKTAKSR